jgi:hypothetical protein
MAASLEPDLALHVAATAAESGSERGGAEELCRRTRRGDNVAAGRSRPVPQGLARDPRATVLRHLPMGPAMGGARRLAANGWRTNAAHVEGQVRLLNRAAHGES